MKVLFSGSRDWDDVDAVRHWFHVLSLGPEDTVIDGAARGLDSIAYRLACEYGCGRVRFPALWAKDGRAAGPMRNQRMLDIAQPEIVLAFPLPKSVGTIHMMRIAVNAGIGLIDCAAP